MRASSEILAQESAPMHTLVRYRHPGGNAREQNSPVSLVESVWITRNRGHEWPAYTTGEMSMNALGMRAKAA
jgi:hypothetical protein